MNRFITSGLTQLVVLLLSWSLVPAQDARLRQEETPQLDAPMPPQNEPRPNRSVFTQPELDQMLAPIALYPDTLLSQILMASTYPLEVVEAARWSQANSKLKGEQAVQAVAQQAWDPSVKSLVAFPQVLMTMDEKLPWMERLGEAFLAQQPQVMDSVQQLRQKASAAGHLTSNEQIRVDQQGQTIAIQPATPQVVYVPYYNPMLMYGPWWWSAYPPVYWGPWPGYVYGPGFGMGFGWGLGIGIGPGPGPGFFFGGFNWQYRYATFAGGGVWAHNPFHRRGVRTGIWHCVNSSVAWAHRLERAASSADTSRLRLRAAAASVTGRKTVAARSVAPTSPAGLVLVVRRSLTPSKA